MISQMARFWPEVRDRYRIADFKLSVRAMPKSASDARLCDVVKVGERGMRVRAGKIDAIFHAEQQIVAAVTPNSGSVVRDFRPPSERPVVHQRQFGHRA